LDDIAIVADPENTVVLIMKVGVTYKITL